MRFNTLKCVFEACVSIFYSVIPNNAASVYTNIEPRACRVPWPIVQVIIWVTFYPGCTVSWHRLKLILQPGYCRGMSLVFNSLLQDSASSIFSIFSFLKFPHTCWHPELKMLSATGRTSLLVHSFCPPVIYESQMMLSFIFYFAMLKTCSENSLDLLNSLEFY